MVEVVMGEMDYMLQVKILFDVRWGQIDYATHHDTKGWVSSYAPGCVGLMC